MKIICFIASLFLSIGLVAQNKYALLIGIGNYPKDSGWNLIHGDNDIHIIKGLLVTQGFNTENIATLTNETATKDEIISNFNSLHERVQLGDVVYIHFSGHGQQITDINGDEDDGFDEAWIPYDAKKKYEAGVYEGHNHLIDDELNAIFTRLRVRVGAKGKIIVIADACHSGSGSRGPVDDEVFVRGTGDKFILPRQTNNIIKKPEPTEWLFVAACKPYQSNYEYRTPDGDYYGVLSYIIANEQKQFDICKYSELLLEWSRSVSEKSRHPQDLDADGQPCRRSSYMF